MALCVCTQIDMWKEQQTKTIIPYKHQVTGGTFQRDASHKIQYYYTVCFQFHTADESFTNWSFILNDIATHSTWQSEVKWAASKSLLMLNHL